MFPDFDDQGNLPPGIHKCTLAEVVVRFGTGSAEREVETIELVQFVQWARQNGVQRLIVDGSYVTAVAAPNDVDIVILPGDIDPVHEVLSPGLDVQWPFLHVLVAADEDDLHEWAAFDFGTDRSGQPRGIVEIEL
jgi:hypothetical protein